MKICAIICEYNPLHNGHLYQIGEAKRLSGADAVLCLMSGNFVQRGEPAVMNKYIRAKHAVNAGADVVLELPTVFATSSAEYFAKGAISILNQIPSVTTLCFGAETAEKELFLQTANLLNNEPKTVSDKIKALTSEGVGYAKARAMAWEGTLSLDLLTSPNNILGVEYTRAILSLQSSIEILPILRKDGGYKDETLNTGFSSATAIRKAVANGEDVQNALPPFVLPDLPTSVETRLQALEKYAVLSTPAEQIAKTLDCVEGLENAFKKCAEKDEPFVESLTSPRYTSSRIRRIALQNLLKIEETLIKQSLQAPLYIKILGIKNGKNALLSALSESNLPILARPRDEALLFDVAKRCYETDLFGEKVHALLYGNPGKINVFID